MYSEKTVLSTFENPIATATSSWKVAASLRGLYPAAAVSVTAASSAEVAATAAGIVALVV